MDIARQSGAQGIQFKVHGFDISHDQFPPTHVLPSNCQLSVSDALATPPAEFHGTFDVVHIAHFACVRALGEDPSPVIDHALALLSGSVSTPYSLRSSADQSGHVEPGGWIQWDEWARDEAGKVPLVKLAASPQCDWALDVSSKIFPEYVLLSTSMGIHYRDYAWLLTLSHNLWQMAT